MITATGRLFTQEFQDIGIDDVIIPLSKTTRWGGSAIDWTVLDHSLFVYNLCWHSGYDSDDVLEAALFHDAHEFVIGDIPKPWKVLLTNIDAVQSQIQLLIEDCLGLRHPSSTTKGIVERFDVMALLAEAQVVLPKEMSAETRKILYAPFGSTSCAAGGTVPSSAIETLKSMQKDRYTLGVDFLSLFKSYASACRSGR